MIDLKFAWRGLKTRHRSQVQELKAIRSALHQGGVSIDVGSNKGSYLYSMARWAQSAPVIAFEPQKNLADYLALACGRSGFSNVTVENLALSDKEGELQIYIPGSSDSPGASLESSIADKTDCHSETVQVTRLDRYLAGRLHQPVKVIKIDVEGHELAVIRGAMQTLGRDKPLLIIECESRHLPAGQSVAGFVADIQALGYAATLARPGLEELPASLFRDELHQPQVGERFWDAKNYYNNFIFRPL